MGHTPGPWKVATTYKLAQRGAAEIVPWNDQGRTLALTQTVKGYSPDESLANARLISAAPDLLTVCKELARLWDTGIRPQIVQGTLREETQFSELCMVTVRAALSKAEGK